MAEDLNRTLARLLRSGEVESATLTVVLKPRPTAPPPRSDFVCRIKVGPVSTKE